MGVRFGDQGNRVICELTRANCKSFEIENFNFSQHLFTIRCVFQDANLPIDAIKNFKKSMLDAFLSHYSLNLSHLLIIKSLCVPCLFYGQKLFLQISSCQTKSCCFPLLKIEFLSPNCSKSSPEWFGSVPCRNSQGVPTMLCPLVLRSRLTATYFWLPAKK